MTDLTRRQRAQRLRRENEGRARAQEAPAPDEAAAVAAALRKIDADLTAYGPFLAPYGITVNAPLIVAALHDAGYRVAQEAPAPEAATDREFGTMVHDSTVLPGFSAWGVATLAARLPACPLCTVGIAQQEPDLHLTNDCGCECHVAQGGSR